MLTERDLADRGFASLGHGLQISPDARFHGVERIHLGDRVRIDDFCVVSAGAGGIRFGRNVHVACFASLIGGAEIVVDDFAGISARASVYSSNDDYSGAHLMGPTVADVFRDVHTAPVRVGRHVTIGAGSVVLPGTTLAEGSIVGALSLVKADTEAFTIYAGVPARRIAARRRDLLDMERRYVAEED